MYSMLQNAGPITLIGIDCAADPANTGLACGRYADGAVTVLDVAGGTRQPPLIETLRPWLNQGGPTLIAVDAPLGWPRPMGDALATHRAGAPLTYERAARRSASSQSDANRFFRRETDRYIKGWLNQQPLDVGADRIARAAFAALDLLEQIAEATGQPVELAWRPEAITGLRAIEVYPAASLKAHGMIFQGYKDQPKRSARKQILAGLAARLRFADDFPVLLNAPDMLDAVVCLLAAQDFLTGAAMAPPPELAEAAAQEGWIWARAPAPV